MMESQRTANEHVPNTTRRALTLVEVLIAAAILALGLIGLAAVFPAVISQQQAANNLSQAITVGASAENILNTRLERFRGPFRNIDNNTGWQRINAYDDADSDAMYLQAPFTDDFDLRLPIADTHAVAPASGRPGRNHSDAVVYGVLLPRSPISNKTLRSVVVTVRLSTGGIPVRLRPESVGSTKFIAERDPSRIYDDEVNIISYAQGRIDFHFRLNGGEQIDEIQIDYFWLNDRIISHEDRLSPSDNPRYAWDMAIRKGLNGQVQYNLFIYQFSGPVGETFYPEIPGYNGVPDGMNYGMIRRAKAFVNYDSGIQKFYIRDMEPELEQALEAGAWLLPVRGNGPVRVRRKINPTNYTQDEGVKWELESPPIAVDDRTGEAYPLSNREVAFLYMPLEVLTPPQQGNGRPVSWRIKPLLSYVKQVDL